MQCFDEIKNINHQQNFYNKIYHISLKNRAAYKRPLPDTVVFLFVAENFSCMRHFADAESLRYLKHKVTHGDSHNVFNHKTIEEEVKKLRYGITFRGFISGRDAFLNYERTMSIFQDEAMLLGVKARTLKTDMMPHIKLAIAYAPDHNGLY